MEEKNLPFGTDLDFKVAFFFCALTGGFLRAFLGCFDFFELFFFSDFCGVRAARRKDPNNEGKAHFLFLTSNKDSLFNAFPQNTAKASSSQRSALNRIIALNVIEDGDVGSEVN